MKLWWLPALVMIVVLSVLEAKAQVIDAPLRAQLIAARLSARSLDVLQEKMISMGYEKTSVVIVDYTLPSNQNRLFLINLKTQTFQTSPVSHASSSGGLYADSFSNEAFTLRSTLGFMLTEDHYGKFGHSLVLNSLSESNTRLNVQKATGPILIHGAEYASAAYLKKYGYLGRSYGCFAVPYEKIPGIVRALGDGALVLSYHDKLWDESLSHPASQELRAPKHGPRPARTDWETEENVSGQNHGKVGFYLNKYVTNEALPVP